MTIFLISAFLFFSDASEANLSSCDEISTFILVRHAEKADDNADPELSDLGAERAELLAIMLMETNIESVYSTGFVRTRETVRILAEQKNLKIHEYDHQSPAEMVGFWLDQHQGETILILGHSNTVPDLANRFMGYEYFTGNFDESDYGNVLIIIKACSQAKLIHMRY